MGHDEDEYYEDDGEFDDEFDLPDEEDRRNRLIKVFSGSYGISIAVHVAILLILATIVIATPAPEKEAVVIAKREVKPQEYDEKLKRDLHKTPKIQSEEVVEKPIIIREQEVEVTQDMPKGTDLSNMSNKNLDSTSVVDAYGAGGGAAGAYGQRWGKGSLSREGGSEGTESAVTAALRWLKRAQSQNGQWDCDNWTHIEKHPKDGYWAGTALGHVLSHRYGIEFYDADHQQQALTNTHGHDGGMVPVFAYGPGAETFQGIYENTEIPKKIAAILGLTGTQ